MPLWWFDQSPRERREASERAKTKRRKHEEIVRLWRDGHISWNEYCRQEKKYR